MYVYSIPFLKFLNLFSEFNFLILKNIWFFLIIFITFFFAFISKRIFFKEKKLFFYIPIFFVLLFSFGGNISNALITGNVSIISYLFVSIGLLPVQIYIEGFQDYCKYYLFKIFWINGEGWQLKTFSGKKMPKYHRRPQQGDRSEGYFN